MGQYLAGNWSPAAGHQCCSPRLNSRVSPVQHFYLGAGVEYNLSKFVDDAKLGGNAYPLEDQEALQKDLGALEHLVISNGVKYSKGKC